MKMSNEMYELFTNFYKLTVEQASDEDVKFIMGAIRNAAEIKKKEMNGEKKEEINLDNPRISKGNAKAIKEFFEDFLKNATDDEAIYLIEGLKALANNAVKNPEEVAKFVINIKKEAIKNAEKK